MIIDLFSSFFLLNFGMKTLIYQTQAAGVVGRGSGRQKWDVSHFSKHRPSGPMLSISQNVHMFVCLSVCLSVCEFTFEVPFESLFAHTSQSQMSNIFRDSESLGKNNERKWSQI